MDISGWTEGAHSKSHRGLAESVLENLREGCQLVDSGFRYLYVNSAAAAQGKKSPVELLGRSMVECYPGIEQTAMFSRLRACMLTRTSDSMENEFAFPDGSKGWFELRFEPVPEGVAILSVDVTERVRAQNVLQRTSRALDVLSRCNQALVRTEEEEQLLCAVCSLLVTIGGYRAARIEILPTKGREMITASAGEPLADIRNEPDALTLSIRGKLASLGALSLLPQRFEETSHEERGVLEEVARDLGYGIETLRNREAHHLAEQQLIASRRLEAVGRMAGGIAHDFSNLMSIVVSYAWMIERQLPQDSAIRSDVQEIHRAVGRATTLTKQLLAFSRNQAREPQPTDANSVISDLTTMLERLLGENVRLSLGLHEELPKILIDPSQLEQVIMNLAVNARDAMPNGGALSITTSDVTVGSEVAIEPGRYVLIRASDNGLGMSVETKERIFEPFFTTKEPGNGTGLGLSTVYGIVTQSGGFITVHSKCGTGTTFEIYLPSLVAAAEQEPRTIVAPSGAN